MRIICIFLGMFMMTGMTQPSQCGEDGCDYSSTFIASCCDCDDDDHDHFFC